MKTIEITSGNQKAQFTTKSMTFNGREFFYANMTDVVNHTDIHTYTFIYDGVSKAFPYEEKDAKVLNVIFSQVQGMQAEKESPASDGQKSVSQPGGAESQKDQKASTPIETPEENTSGKQTPAASPEGESISGKEMQKTVSEEAKASQTQAAKPDNGKISEKQAQTPDAADKKSKGKPSVKGIFSAKKKKKSEKKDAFAEDIEVDPHRQAKLKKSFTIFGIIIAIVIVLSLIWYFAFGTSNNPAPSNPNSTESQQYNDIDELIKDMQ